MVLDAKGKVADTRTVRDAIAKKRAGRRIPMRAICASTRFRNAIARWF
jgi:hypothetical protein